MSANLDDLQPILYSSSRVLRCQRGPMYPLAPTRFNLAETGGGGLCQERGVTWCHRGRPADDTARDNKSWTGNV